MIMQGVTHSQRQHPVEFSFQAPPTPPQFGPHSRFAPVGPVAPVRVIDGVAQVHHLPPAFISQPMTFLDQHPQNLLNARFDYEEANFLHQVPIRETRVYCPICQTTYGINDREAHKQKHIRRKSNSRINADTLARLSQYRSQQQSSRYMVKPVIPPEEHFVDYRPNCYQLIKETVYEDQMNNSTHEVGVGDEPIPENAPEMAYNVSRESIQVPTHDHSAPPHPPPLLADSSNGGAGRESVPLTINSGGARESVPLKINSPTGRREAASGRFNEQQEVYEREREQGKLEELKEEYAGDSF